MQGLTDGGIYEDGAGLVLLIVCKWAACKEEMDKDGAENEDENEDKGRRWEERRRTYGNGGKLAGSVSCGIVVQVSTQWDPFCHGYPPNTPLLKLNRYVTNSKHLV